MASAGEQGAVQGGVLSGRSQQATAEGEEEEEEDDDDEEDEEEEEAL